MLKREAIVFIDGSNWYHNSKSLIGKSKRIDFNCLAKLICEKFDLILKQIRYYNAVPDIKDDKEVYYNHIKFLDKLKKDGVIVKTRKLKYIKKLKIKIEKGVDVLIASDMIRKTLVKKECKVCVLISGDADFIPVMEIIKDSKNEAITCSVINGYARELLQGKFRYLILKKEDLDSCCL
ncbi:MAG: NYN domain-containing protein [Nanoarchaeota archaeon]|nr:NYN domain-containing protein [Nanoarchaeota archaeon]MBU1028497.1 NYN domain-containing protein [Nanoarchaeota archaeon]